MDFARVASLMILPAICLLAFTIRFAAVRQMDGLSIVHELLMDESIYERHAIEILNGNLAPSDALFKNPLYPYLLAAVYAVFGHKPMTVLLLQVLLDVLTCLMTYYIGWFCFNRKTGWIAAALYALYGIAIFYTGLRLPSTMSIFLFTTSLLLFIRASRNVRPRLMFPAGAMFGLLLLIQPNTALILIVLPFWFFFPRKNRFGRRDMLVTFAAFYAGVFLCTFPVMAKNWMVSDEYFPSAHGGINFYIGNNPHATGTYMKPEGISNLPEEQLPSSIRMAEQQMGRPLTAGESSRFWFREGFRWLTNHPADAFHLYLRKFALFWRSEEIGLNIDFRFFQELIPALKRPAIPFGLIAPLGLLGMAMAFFAFPRSRLAMIFLLSYMVSLVLFFICDRYRLPIIPVLSVFAAFAVTRIFTLLAKPRLETAWAIAGLAVLCFLINVKNERFIRPTYTTESHYDFMLGKHYFGQKQFGKAIAAFEKSLTNDRRNPSTLFLIGLAYHFQGRNDASTRMLQQAVEIRPDFAKAHVQLGVNYGIAGDMEKALRHLEKAYALAPEDVDVLKNLGIARLKTQRVDQAIADLSMAAELAPDDASIRKRLGAAYFYKGYLKPAETHLQKACDLDPDDAESRRFREEAAVALANYERQATLLMQEWKRNSQDGDLAARIGNVYAAAGDFTKAVGFFRQALMINPNSAAVLVCLGNALARQHLFAEAEQAFLQATRLRPRNARLYYNLACLYSLQNDAETSVQWLKKALERGYDHWDRIMNDEDLDRLRASRWFDAVRDRQLARLSVN